MMSGLKTSPGHLTGLTAICVIIAATSPALAQVHAPAPQAATAATRLEAPSESPTPKVLTGKERLGEKWTDEQRVDNCRVPVDKRGPRPRPDTCPGGLE